MSGRAGPSGQREAEGVRQGSKRDRVKKRDGAKRTRVNATLSFLPTPFLLV